jgi:hypothetical protein
VSADEQRTKLTNDSNSRTHSLAEHVRNDAEKIFVEREASKMQRIKDILNGLTIINRRPATVQQQTASQQHMSWLFGASVQYGWDLQSEARSLKKAHTDKW